MESDAEKGETEENESLKGIIRMSLFINSSNIQLIKNAPFQFIFFSSLCTLFIHFLPFLLSTFLPFYFPSLFNHFLKS